MKNSDLVLALGMLITGSVNTLSTNWANVTKSPGRDGHKDEFNHPFFQAAGMFLGEMLCLMAFRISEMQARRNNKAFHKGECPSYLFLLPAMCDLVGTSTMYLGLTMTTPSVFQMLRGSVVIFTGVLSVFFLKRKLMGFHWAGMVLVLVGAAVVGLSSVINKDDSGDDDDGGSSNVVLGNALIVCAQMIVAVQMVVEEKFLAGYRVPALQAVGLEGMFGFSILVCVLAIAQFATVDGARMEDSYDAMVQMSHSPVICIALLGNVCSIAGFNFFGISVTKALSASHRMVLDSVRTIVVWAVSLLVGWEEFHYLQVIGFVILMTGTTLYNEILVIPALFSYTTEEEDDEANAKLLNGDEEIGGGERVFVQKSPGREDY